MARAITRAARPVRSSCACPATAAVVPACNAAVTPQLQRVRRIATSASLLSSSSSSSRSSLPPIPPEILASAAAAGGVVLPGPAAVPDTAPAHRRTTVLLIGWLGATDRQLGKFKTMHEQSGRRVIVWRPWALSLLFPQWVALRSLEKRVLPPLRNAIKEHNLLLVHALSNQGAFHLAFLLQVLHHRAESFPEQAYMRELLARHIRGIVFDSAPAPLTAPLFARGFTGWITSLHTPLRFASELFEKHWGIHRSHAVRYTHPLWTPFFECAWTVLMMLPFFRTHINVLHRGLAHLIPTHAALLYIYGKDDRLIPYETIRAHAAQQIKFTGMPGAAAGTEGGGAASESTAFTVVPVVRDTRDTDLSLVLNTFDYVHAQSWWREFRSDRMRIYPETLYRFIDRWGLPQVLKRLAITTPKEAIEPLVGERMPTSNARIEITQRMPIKIQTPAAAPRGEVPLSDTAAAALRAHIPDFTKFDVSPLQFASPGSIVHQLRSQIASFFPASAAAGTSPLPLDPLPLSPVVLQLTPALAAKLPMSLTCVVKPASGSGVVDCVSAKSRAAWSAVRGGVSTPCRLVRPIILAEFEHSGHVSHFKTHPAAYHALVDYFSTALASQYMMQCSSDSTVQRANERNAATAAAANEAAEKEVERALAQARAEIGGESEAIKPARS